MMTKLFDTSVVCPVLIGRTASRASCERVFEQLGNGQGQTVLVSGEADIGTSCLVAEASAHWAGADALPARARGLL